MKAIIASVGGRRSEEHTSELQSLRRISYAVFCLKKKSSGQEHAVDPQGPSAAGHDGQDTGARPLWRRLRGHENFFFFNDPAPPEIYTYCHTLSLHDALPISVV